MKKMMYYIKIHLNCSVISDPARFSCGLTGLVMTFQVKISGIYCLDNQAGGSGHLQS